MLKMVGLSLPAGGIVGLLGGAVIKGKETVFEKGVDHLAESCARAGGKGVPLGGKGLIKAFGGQADVFGLGEETSAEFIDGAADESAGGLAEEIFGQQQGKNFVLVNLGQRKMKGRLAVEIALVEGIVFEGCLQAVA